MSARKGLLKRVYNEGGFGFSSVFRAGVILGGFLLTKIFETAGLFKTVAGRKAYYSLYALGKSMTDGDKVRLMRERLGAGDCYLDIGGGYGFFACVGADLVGPSGKVYVFEPDPTSLSFIYDRIKAGGYKNIEVVEKAAWFEDTVLELHICAENRGENSVFGSPVHCETVSVPALAVDNALPEGQRVQYVKIDVQGAEFQVLQGLGETLKRSPGVCLVCECCPDDLELADVSVSMLLELLAGFGLDVYRIDREPYVRVRDAADLADLNERDLNQCDLLCVPSGATV